ncbi:GNAT family N-acetyltransferase [Acidocella sp.]|uniref:GNAT family N-acetyltransferase n=1 Tax=Acidocella sp. TaxID=50710 RepID=UPI002638FA0C|nr:GNAT family N-acetyltransferase [Acidocella sp.]MDD2794929.1 GNAT family N-acetyltransferase [Acidocella sp.]
MIAIRRARAADAPGIAAVHVATWRNTYATLLPETFLAGLSAERLSLHYERSIRMGHGVFVAVLSGERSAPQVVGFSTARRCHGGKLGDGEVETLYVADDWQNKGLGGQFLRVVAKYLASRGCRSVFIWVLHGNPAIFFYERLGGRRLANGTTYVAGSAVPQVAYAWDPIETLLDVDA